MKPSLKDIEFCTRQEFRISRPDLKGPIRNRRIAHARFLAFHVAREMTARSFPYIASHFQCDHTTVVYGCMKIGAALPRDPATVRNVERLRSAVALRAAQARAAHFGAVWKIILAQPFADVGAGI